MMKVIKSASGQEIQPFDVIKNIATEVLAVASTETIDGRTGLVAWNDVIKMTEFLEDYPEGQWEIVGSFLTYWCEETFVSKKLQIIKEEE